MLSVSVHHPLKVFFGVPSVSRKPAKFSGSSASTPGPGQDSIHFHTRPGILPEAILNALRVSPEVRAILKAREQAPDRIPAPCLGTGRIALEILAKNASTLYAHGTPSDEPIYFLSPHIAHPAQKEGAAIKNLKLGNSRPDGSLVKQKVPKLYVAPLKYMDFPISRATMKGCGRHSSLTFRFSNGTEISLYGAQPDTKAGALKRLEDGIKTRVYIMDGRSVGYDAQPGYGKPDSRTFPIPADNTFSLDGGEFTTENEVAPIGYVEVTLADYRDYRILQATHPEPAKAFLNLIPDSVVPGVPGYNRSAVIRYMKAIGLPSHQQKDILQRLKQLEKQEAAQSATT